MQLGSLLAYMGLTYALGGSDFECTCSILSSDIHACTPIYIHKCNITSMDDMMPLEAGFAAKVGNRAYNCFVMHACFWKLDLFLIKLMNDHNGICVCPLYV
jgi:hypothetical protein